MTKYSLKGMKLDGLVSVAMATYNGEKYLRKQLDSIFNQTYNNIEVVVTDDCSCDATVKILEEYSKVYNLKYYVNDKNLGYCKNFERALSLCNGEFIALSDQDDIWLPEKISVLVEEIGENDLVCSNAVLINNDGDVISNSFKDYAKHRIIDDNSIYSASERSFITGCTALFRKTLLEKALPVPNSVKHHDLWLGIIAMWEKGVKYVETPLIEYRQHGNNQVGACEGRTFFSRIVNSFNFKSEKNASLIVVENELVGRLEAMIDYAEKYEKVEVTFLKNLLVYYKLLLVSRFSAKVLKVVLFGLRKSTLSARVRKLIVYYGYLFVK